MYKDFFLGFVKTHILYHASKEPVYGVEMLEELGRHGYRLEREGYLSMHKRVVEGKVRKYYTITGPGLAVLDEAKRKIAELVNEVLMDE